MTESLSEWQMELEEDLNATADQDLGTAVAVCDGEGRYDDGSLLEVCELRYGVDSDSWAPQIVAASLLVDPLLLNAVTDPAAETLHTTLQRLHPDISISVRVQPKRVPPGWRQGRIEARLSDVGPNNQATYRTLPDDHPRQDGLKFHNVSDPARRRVPHQPAHLLARLRHHPPRPRRRARGGRASAPQPRRCRPVQGPATPRRRRHPHRTDHGRRRGPTGGA